jgi:CHAD domain-containing protein
VRALHELRKDCKKLRYATEFFARSFPGRETKPFLKRLTALQEDLGTLNDTAVAAQLMAQLGRTGRGYAGGLVEGWASAAAAPARKRTAKVWKRFRASTPFWQA